MRQSISLVVTAILLSACGPSRAPDRDLRAPAAQNGRALPTGPVLSGVGTVIALQGSDIVLDHEAVEGGLAAGRDTFQVDARVLAEAPIEPGDRVAFAYQDWTPAPLLVEMKAR